MQEISLNEYLELNKKINAYSNKKKLQKKIKIAILGSFTLNGFAETLNVKCHNIGINASFYVNNYNQYINELIDKNSGFYKFKPDISFLLVDAKSIFGDPYIDPYKVSEKKRRDLVRHGFKALRALVNNFTKYGHGILVMNNFDVPTYSPVGILEPKQRFGLFDMARRMNQHISDFNQRRSVFIFDYDSFISGIGKKNTVNDKLLYLADMKISPDLIPVLCEEYMRYVKAVRGLTKKCIVLDLDNTLWGGIVGEDGLGGIKLGPVAPGNAYMEFQKHILALFRRGVILAVNSSNNEGDVIKVMREHPYMVLKEHHFASIKINWENKVKNLTEIAKDINIGLNSIIYLDDDKRNRQVVREALPEVCCPDLPEDASLYAKFLRSINDLDVLQITHEDRKRGKLYAAERKRKESKSDFKNLSKYLEHLNIIAEVKRADKFSIPRLSQLTLRTNQFNFSTKRYNEKEMQRMISDKKYDIYYTKVKDKYGDYGITGAVIIEKNKKTWFVDTFLMSCRILGKNIEDAALSVIIKKAVKAKVNRVSIDYRRTEKNQPVTRFLEQYGILANKNKSKNTTLILYEKRKRIRFDHNTKHIKIITR